MNNIDYYTLDFGRFVAGEVVIWSAVFGVYFLIRQHYAQPCAAPNGGPATPIDNSGFTEGPPSAS